MKKMQTQGFLANLKIFNDKAWKFSKDLIGSTGFKCTIHYTFGMLILKLPPLLTFFLFQYFISTTIAEIP